MDLANWVTVVVMVVLQILQGVVIFTKRGKDVERIDKEMEMLRKAFDELRLERKTDNTTINGRLDAQHTILTEIRVGIARMEGRNEVRTQKP